ncbi:putative ribosomal large subunit pseudouridine synthase SVR1, chloroplastic, partial [Mucuna pruriens]
MGATTAIAALSLHCFSKSHTHIHTHTFSSFRTLPRLTCSFSSSIKFNISFAPPKPKPKPDPEAHAPNEPDGPLLIPWIVRGEDGNLKLQSEPPPSLLKAMVTAQTGAKKDKKQTKTIATTKPQKVPAAAPPQYSKAARRFYNQTIKDTSGERLSKVLAASGGGFVIAVTIASRRSCEELIFKGKVTVNGSVCNTPQTRVDPAKDVIYVNGNRLPKRQPQKVYLALNKPKGHWITVFEMDLGLYFSPFLMKSSLSHKNILPPPPLLQGKKHPGVPAPRLFTVGRLDVATTGYIATVDGVVHKRHLITISEGTIIEGVHCVPDSVELLPRQPDMQRARLRIVVHEGRKHEVRELVKRAGLEIHSLKRVRIGGFRLPPDLGPGIAGDTTILFKLEDCENTVQILDR